MVIFYTDYSISNHHTIAWVKKFRNGKTRDFTLSFNKSLFLKSSTSGELLSIYYALLDAVKNRYKNVIVRNDNKVAVALINNTAKPRKYEIKFILFLINGLQKEIKSSRVEWVPRTQNKEADKLTRT